jgi:hypothetical protein
VPPLRLLVIGYEGSPSTRLRALQYLDDLRRDGFETTTLLFPRGSRAGSRTSIQSVWRQLMGADVILVQRVLSRRLNLLLRASRKPTVFDLGDAVHYIRSTQLEATDHPSTLVDRGRVLYRRGVRGSRYYSSRKRVLEEMLKLSQAAIFGNPVLESELSGRVRGESIVLPTAVPVSRANLKVHGASAPVTIGWIGTRGNLFHLQKLEPVFERLRARLGDRAQLAVVTNQEYRSNSLPTVFTEWSLEEESELVRSFDIGVMPLVDDPFSRGKCAFKAILSMSFGVPVVISPVGMNAELVRDGWNGFLASTHEEWERALVQLVSDHQLRAQLGTNAYETIEAGYSTERTYPVLRDALLRAASSEPAP